VRIDAIELVHISIPLVGPFRISRGTIVDRHMLLVRVHADGAYGWGEAGADLLPLYTYETVGTCRHLITDLFAPDLFGREWPDEGAAIAVAEHHRQWPWHPMAKAVVEEAMWDLEARRRGVPLHRLYAGDRPVRDRVEVGISLGIQEDFGVLADQIDAALGDGYRRIKLKIARGFDFDVLDQVRARFGDIPLMVDANCGYGEEDIDTLVRLDDYDLIMVEQPFEYEALAEHAALQERLRYKPKALKRFFKQQGLSRLNVLRRHFPLDVRQIRQQLQLQEGGDQFLICTTWEGEKVAWRAERCVVR